jgi:hypothetical protein
LVLFGEEKKEEREETSHMELPYLGLVVGEEQRRVASSSTNWTAGLLLPERRKAEEQAT